MCGCSQAAKTGQDSFLLGPSGYGFLHPGQIPTKDHLLPKFVDLTVDALHMLSASAYVHWDDYDNRLARQAGLRNSSQHMQVG